MISCLRLFAGHSQKTDRQLQKKVQYEKWLVGKFANGNVNLKVGRYITKDDKIKRLEKLIKNRFF